jgi:hypothetical protein
MADGWQKMTAAEVQPGDRVRLASGEEVIATKIEAAFMGREGRLAFIEDTPERWYKRPSAADAEVEVLRGS